MSIEKVKAVGGVAGGVLLVLAFLVLPILFLLGLANFSVWALDWIPSAIGVAMLVCLVLIPLAIIPASRSLAANLFGLASLVFGICLWLYALAFTYIEWGLIAVVIGVLIAGVGVVLTGALAALFSGTWVVLGNLAILFALYFGARLLAAWLTHLAEARALAQAMREAPSEVIIPHRISAPEMRSTTERSVPEEDR